MTLNKDRQSLYGVSQIFILHTLLVVPISPILSFALDLALVPGPACFHHKAELSSKNGISHSKRPS